MIEKKKTTLLSPEPGPMSARGLQHRTGYERDEPRFELIFRKSKTRSSTRSVVRVPGYPRLAIVSVSIRSTKSREEGGGGRSRKQLERRWRLHETAEALEEIPSSGGGDRIDRQRRAAVDKQPRIPTPAALHPELKFDFRRKSRWTCPQRAETGHLMMDYFQGEDLRCSNKNEV